MNKELLQQALDALLEYDYAKTDKADKLGGAAIYALRIAIAQPEHPTKPVAWWIPKAEQFCLPDKDGSRPFANAWEPLYASPPIAQPVPIEGDAKDAKRYQFLEYQCRTGTYRGIISRKAIDEAIASQKAEP